MDLRHLRYFIAVAEELNFTRAADRLHIAQPPLSQQIRQLEEELGVTLLHRTKRHVELSEAGQVFLDHARQILRSTEVAAMQARRAQRGEIGRLSVGFFEHMSYTLLPPIFRAYRERFPDVDVDVRWFPVIGQADALRRGDVDISFMRPGTDSEDITTEVLVTEPFVIAVPASHPFAAEDSLSLRDCAAEHFVMYMPHLAPDFHDMILRMCATAGFTPRVALEVGQVYTCLGLVSSGIGLAFVPSSVQRIHLDHVVYKPLRSRSLPAEVMLGWRTTNTSPLIGAFVETAKEVIAASGGAVDTKNG
ncbi:LysR substrate-binding domain-containing protein [Stenotrophomonas maltophilia]|uniref:LysR substrate-binding domain-containing protein n=2 Tax=Stenotrophomonas maltophilia TaxID=40324 RepID=UPI0013D956BD|nr:LysR substrate-binding domain-containing protein [Stenotrophomonas maltophilia]